MSDGKKWRRITDDLPYDEHRIEFPGQYNDAGVLLIECGGTGEPDHEPHHATFLIAMGGRSWDIEAALKRTIWSDGQRAKLEAALENEHELNAEPDLSPSRGVVWQTGRG